MAAARCLRSPVQAKGPAMRVSFGAAGKLTENEREKPDASSFCATFVRLKRAGEIHRTRQGEREREGEPAGHAT